MLRFREGKYATVSDIEQMFHQTNVRPENQDALRFLWQNESNRRSHNVHTSIWKNWFLVHSQLDIEKDSKDSEEVVSENTIDQINRNFIWMIF